VVVNETMARRFWPGENPLGRAVQVRGRQAQVIGIARDVKYSELYEDPQPYLYLSIRQSHIAMSSLHVRTLGDPGAFMPQIVRTVEEMDPNLPVRTRTMSEQIDVKHFLSYLALAVVGCFGLLALALALVGVYSVTSHSVRQRVHEFGIRTALGAGRREILRLVLNRGLFLASFGVGLGLAASIFVTGVLSGFLFGVSPLDPTIFVGVSVVLTAAVLLACYIPARWAAAVDPAVALHYE
jgi:predicted lysophospholipase L1 biosynthesis ABC-type transport system permease subunit